MWGALLARICIAVDGVEYPPICQLDEGCRALLIEDDEVLLRRVGLAEDT